MISKMFFVLRQARAWPLITMTVLGIFMSNGIHRAGGQSIPARPAKGELLGNIDVRMTDRAATLDAAGKNVSLLQGQARIQSADLSKAISDFKTNTPGADVTLSPMTGAVETVRSNATFLTGPARGSSGTDVVRNFIANHSALYGLNANEINQLHFIGESVSKGSGLRMVRVEQTVNGRPVFQSETRFSVNRDGRLVRSVGLMVSNPTISAAPLVGLISAKDALKAAMASVRIGLDTAKMTEKSAAADGMEAEIAANDDAVPGEVHSNIVYFAIAPGTLIPAWSQVAFTTGPGDWYTLVDARTGTLLWRKNIRDYASTEEARFRVYVQSDGVTPADNPAPKSPTTALPGGGTQFPEIAPTIVTMSVAQDLATSPNGWIDDGGSSTTGNNVDAYLDRVGGGGETNVPDIGALDNNGRPVGNPDADTKNRDFLGTTPRDFQTGFLPPPQGGNPEAGQTCSGSPDPTLDSFRRGAVTQLFYVCNWYHDQLYALGFDEAAGNFQQTNFSGMGLGADRVRAEAEDSSGTDNANFSTPPDGLSGRAQMYRFVGPTIDRDGDLDSEVLIHELSHGLSNRLIGNAAGLQWSPGQGMGEGWSDFYALSLLNGTNGDDPDAKYAAGAYATYKFIFPSISPAYLDNYVYGIRRFPYSTNNSVNPLTWADTDDVTNNLSGGIAPDPNGFNSGGGFEVHNIGEVWCVTLWEVRSRVIADAAGANGDVPTGNQTMLQLVTDAMKLTPNNPSFTDARDALLDTDAATNSSANEDSIWNGFADRGLGYNAYAPLGIVGYGNFGHMALRESFSIPYLDVESVTIDDSGGNNNGAIDPGETVNITVQLTNPWRKTSKGVASATATLSTSNPHVTLGTSSSVYPAIAAQGNASGTAFTFTVSSAATAGEALRFSITPTSALGTHVVDFLLRVGTPSGNGTPITYTKTLSPGLAIPDRTLRGVTNSVTITDDFEIADLNFRIDNLLHTFTGDITALLKAPNGYGSDLIWLRGALFGFGTGDNFIFTVIDDQATNDLNQSADAQAPFTGSWLPAFNSPVWNLVSSVSGPDPVGQLGRLNGQSTKGTWTILVADNFTTDTGTLNSWSLIVTPRAYTVQAVGPATASLGDRVWSDGNGNGVQDSGEPGLNGVTVELLNSSSSVIATTTTAGDGNYTFSSLAAGTYTVRIIASTLPSGATPTYDLDGVGTPHRATVSLIAGQTRTDVDFGYNVSASPTPPPHHRKHHHRKHNRKRGG